MVVRLVQFSKALLPIVSTPSLNSTEAKLPHPAKDLLPIVSRFCGMTTSFSLVQFSNALSAIEVVYASAAILLRVGEHVDNLVGHVSRDVEHALVVLKHLVSLRVEGVVVRVEHRVAPYAFARYRYT